MRAEIALLVASAASLACGPSETIRPRVAGPSPLEERWTPKPRPLSAAAQAPAGPVVILERVTDWAGGEGSCKVDDDCVVVDHFQQAELCPPGLSVSRELAEAEVVYRLRNGPYRVRPGHCPDMGLAIRPVCSDGTCAAQRSPESESQTNDESIVQRELPEIEACYRATLKAASDLELSLTVQLVVARNGVVSYARADEGGSEDLRRCVVRRLYGLEFPFPERTRKVNVPLTFRPRRDAVTRSP
ncbi:MAG: AgmX/PglI C-terminal domain-containing protein [Myxococcales bacterium]|nr:AgmX/PglI C-terminal domain-containing protein [Myxococcales bacterium]